MKKFSLFLLLCCVVVLVCTGQTKNDPVPVNRMDITAELEQSLKKSLTNRFFIPGDTKKILSEELILTDSTFTYTLKTVSFSDVDRYTETETMPFYSTVSAQGPLPTVTDVQGRKYKITVTGTAKISEEAYSYYGYKDLNTYSRFLDYTYTLDTAAPAEVEPESSLYYAGTVRKLTRDDLSALSLDELGYLRNEFFARNGYIFKTEKMNAYFSKKSWYVPVTENVTLNKIETENVDFIRSLEQELALGNNPADVKKINDIYASAQTRLLREDDIVYVAPYMLPYLRNTFYARKGLVFYLLQYQDYFEAQDWYNGTSRNVDNLLSDLDKKNIQFILSYEAEY